MGCCGSFRLVEDGSGGDGQLVNQLCCPVVCDQVVTEGDEQVTVPAFNLVVADGQLVELTLTGYVTRTDNNNGGQDTGYVHVRATARRNDADAAFAGLAILLQSAVLQDSFLGLGTLPAAGMSTLFIVSGNTLQVQLDSAVGTWFWDLQLNYCVRDVLVHVVVA